MAGFFFFSFAIEIIPRIIAMTSSSTEIIKPVKNKNSLLIPIGEYIKQNVNNKTKTETTERTKDNFPLLTILFFSKLRFFF